MSLPSRGAWIEIRPGGRGISHSAGRSPRGERGLKLDHKEGAVNLSRSLPSRGAWIEMSKERAWPCATFVAPLAGSVD